jgi:NAD(P)-dependent dehydrogenase (short-subunit alcohol dehydrogenase family)
MRFAGRTALVTGAGSGIGREVCVAFAREGAAVVAIGRRQIQIDETLSFVEAAGGRGCALAADVSEEPDIRNAFAKSQGAFGPIDYAINNAGVGQSAAMATADISDDEWEYVQRINLTGVWLCMREQLKHMHARGQGAIVNIASLAGLRSLPMHSAYVASKHAVVGLTRNAAVEYASSGVRVNAVCPGGINTAMMRSFIDRQGANNRATLLSAAASRHPMNRLGLESEVASAALFLCSEEAAFITGQCLSVDGGRAVG